MDVEVVGVPFDGYGRDGHQARAASVLREAGLVAAARTPLRDGGDLGLPPFTDRPGPRTGLLNEPALEAMTDGLRTRIASAVESGTRSLVVGGDCSLLLGVVAGLQDAAGPVGLLFVDGHEDTMPVDVVEDGEAANCELGVLLGLTGRLLGGPLAAVRGLLDPRHLSVVGVRDADWRRRFNVGSLADVGVWTHDLERTRPAPATTGRQAAARLGSEPGRWWLHVDLDVLDPLGFGAQGLPDLPDEPGGLDWPELTELLVAAVGVPGCVGISLAIYDPDQDDDRSDAARIVALAHAVLDGLV